MCHTCTCRCTCCKNRILLSYFLRMNYCLCNSCLMAFAVYGCTVKTMRQLSCTDRLTAGLALALECLYYSTYCALAVQRKVLYARRCSYSSWGEPERAPPSAPQRCIVCHTIIIIIKKMRQTIIPMRMCRLYVKVQGSVNPSCVEYEKSVEENTRDHRASESAARRETRLAS